MQNKQPNDGSWHLLVQALLRNDTQEFRSILEREGWPRQCNDWSDYELLVMAINHCHRSIVDILLEKGCRIAKDGCNAKPFHNVVKLDWVDVAKKFLDRGARVYDQDDQRNTALHVAFLFCASDAMIELLLERLVKETSLNLENTEGFSVWHVMCAGSNCKFVNNALDCGFADISSKVSLTSKSLPGFAGYTGLHFAVQYNRLETARLLLERNANIYTRDATGSTPLHLACKCRNVEMIDLIFSYDKTIDNLVNDFGLSHFMAACAGSNVSIVKDFLKNADLQPWSCPKALVNSRVNENCYYPLAGYTPQHFAAEFGRYEIMTILLSYEPHCCPINTAKLTPPALASKGKHQNILSMLLRYCINYRKYKKLNDTDQSQSCQTTPKIESDGYQIPDAWFLRIDRPREYPRYIHARRSVIPIYAPRPGMKYHITTKFCHNHPYVRTYFML